MRALVLSGGGSKGSYEIGVWKALRKLHIKFDIVTGTSIGALNGALITQKSYYKALKLWNTVNLELLFGEQAANKKNDLEIMKMYGKEFLKNGGMDVKEIEKLIRKQINYKKVMKSKIDFGLVTYNVTTKKPIEITKKEIPENLFADYLMASASCYPAFKQKDIEGERYIDGGIYDNLPINLAIKMGADEIIAVDLSAPGLNRTPKKKLKTTRIKPNNKLTNFLNFHGDGAKRNIKLGYNDTLKKYKKLEGKTYTFKNKTLKKNYKKHFETYEYILTNILNNEKVKKDFLKLLKLSNISLENVIAKISLKIMESVAKDLNLDETIIYTERSFNKLLKKKLKTEQTKEKNQLEKMINEIKENKKGIKKKILLNPWLFLKALYLYTICEV